MATTNHHRIMRTSDGGAFILCGGRAPLADAQANVPVTCPRCLAKLQAKAANASAAALASRGQEREFHASVARTTAICRRMPPRSMTMDRKDAPAANGYDSTADTLKHIRRVQQLLGEFASELIRRGTVHDDSKLGPEEKEAFDRETPKLKTLTFGTEEYKASLAALGPALQHHYAHNTHHPEHYTGIGVAGMDLFDLVEMTLDWKAASERQAGATINLDASFKRFEVEPQLASIIRNTASRLGWTGERQP